MSGHRAAAEIIVEPEEYRRSRPKVRFTSSQDYTTQPPGNSTRYPENDFPSPQTPGSSIPHRQRNRPTLYPEDDFFRPPESSAHHRSRHHPVPHHGPRDEYAPPHPQYEYTSRRSHDVYPPPHPRPRLELSPPRYQYEYTSPRPREAYPPPRSPAPSTPYQSRYRRTPSPTPYFEAPPDHSPTASPRQYHNAGYESERTDGGSRSPSPEDETRGSPTHAEVVKPMGPRPSRETVTNPDKPFLFLGSVIDAFDLAENILDFSECAYGSGSDTTVPVVAFVNQLTGYGVGLRGLRDGVEFCKREEISRRWPDASNLIDSYNRRVAVYNTDLQRIVAACQAAMPSLYRERNGSIKWAACLKFTRTLLAELKVNKGLIAAMCDWRSCYGAELAPFLPMMSDEKERLDEEDRLREDRRRRREEHAQREEHARRREGHGHRRRRH